MSRKKILFVIVEGLSDEIALGTVINRIYDNQQIFVQVTHGDITSDKTINTSNIIRRIHKFIKDYADKFKLKQSDFCQIVHIADMDGAFVPDTAVVEDKSAKSIIYSTTEIKTCDKNKIEQRNHIKQANLELLVRTSKIWTIPYEIYYMSCNLDHVLYKKLNSTTLEKMKDARSFANKYRNDIPSFLDYINNSEFSVDGGYDVSWQYIRNGLHSLERHTNLGIYFKATGVVHNLPACTSK